MQWQFTYSGAGVTASGDLTTLATPVGGEYQIVGLTGTRNGVAMNALLPGGTYSASGGGLLISDNELSPTAPYLDLSGFTFNAGNDLFNVYQSAGQYYDLAVLTAWGLIAVSPVIWVPPLNSHWPRCPYQRRPKSIRPRHPAR